MPKSKQSSQNFEASYKDLEKIITKMESGKLSLSDSLSSFEQGIALINQCQELLTNAKQKVEILMEEQEEKFQEFELEHDLDTDIEEDD